MEHSRRTCGECATKTLKESGESLHAVAVFKTLSKLSELISEALSELEKLNDHLAL